MAGVFEMHDRSAFDATAVSIGPSDNSPMRQRLEASFDNFIDVTMQSDADVVRQIRAAEVDILIDLKGYTLGARSDIFACRSAPIQVNYLGYPGTMGQAILITSLPIPL
jgi:predicted O-linked N-acetylglucosamine transferase (SPINDLY family)